MKTGILIKILLFFVVCEAFSQPYGNEWINYSQKHYRISIPKTGLYRIDYTTLINAGIPLGKKLIEFAILQSGMQESPLSFTELIPYEIFGNIVSSVVKDNISPMDAINYSVQFYLNNRTNDDIVKKGKKRAYEDKKLRKDDLLPFHKIPQLKAPFRNNTPSQIDALKRAGVKPWMSSPQLVLVTADGQIDVPDFGQVQDFRSNSSLKVYGTKEMNAFTAQALKSINTPTVQSTVTQSKDTSTRLKENADWQDKNCILNN